MTDQAELTSKLEEAHVQFLLGRLQGEGLHSGRSAFFLRLAGCEVGCPWCDTKHSWPEAAHPRLSVEDLIALL